VKSYLKKSVEFLESNDDLADVLRKFFRSPQLELICSKHGTFNLYA